jgi:hypothetical protein
LRARAIVLGGGANTDFGEKQNERRIELLARLYFQFNSSWSRSRERQRSAMGYCKWAPEVNRCPLKPT